MFRKFACGLFNYLTQFTVPISFSRIVVLVPFSVSAVKQESTQTSGQKRYGADRAATVTTQLSIETLAGFGS